MIKRIKKSKKEINIDNLSKSELKDLVTKIAKKLNIKESK